MQRHTFQRLIAAQAAGQLPAAEAQIGRALRHRRITTCAHTWNRFCTTCLLAEQDQEHRQRQPWPAAALPPVA